MAEVFISICRRNDGGGNLKIAAGRLAGVSFIDIGQIDLAQVEDAWRNISVPFGPQDDYAMIELWMRRQQQQSPVLVSMMASGIYDAYPDLVRYATAGL